jgi:hypothetical protein
MATVVSSRDTLTAKLHFSTWPDWRMAGRKARRGISDSRFDELRVGGLNYWLEKVTDAANRLLQ